MFAERLQQSDFSNVSSILATISHTRRVWRELGNKKNIVVINDEAHHCYRRKVEMMKRN